MRLSEYFDDDNDYNNQHHYHHNHDDDDSNVSGHYNTLTSEEERYEVIMNDNDKIGAVECRLEIEWDSWYDTFVDDSDDDDINLQQRHSLSENRVKYVSI